MERLRLLNWAYGQSTEQVAQLMARFVGWPDPEDAIGRSNAQPESQFSAESIACQPDSGSGNLGVVEVLGQTLKRLNDYISTFLNGNRD